MPAKKTALRPGTGTGARSRFRDVKLFISYSHLDMDWKGHLLPVLSGLRYHAGIIARGGGVRTVYNWHDGELTPGDRWDDEIRTELGAMDIFVALVSYNFMGSKYIREVELPEAERRHRDDKIKVLPILLHPVELREQCPFLHGFSTLPDLHKAWSQYRDRCDAHKVIAEALRKAVENVLEGRGP